MSGAVSGAGGGEGVSSACDRQRAAWGGEARPGLRRRHGDRAYLPRLCLPPHTSNMAPVYDRPGYWGEPTSTLDWCEENYAVSFYVAEFCKFIYLFFNLEIYI